MPLLEARVGIGLSTSRNRVKNAHFSGEIKAALNQQGRALNQQVADLFAEGLSGTEVL
jgi:hypothetical protein